MDPAAPTRFLGQLSLRALLVLISLFAAYWGGWVSHRAWNRRNVTETMRRAFEEAESRYPVQVEQVEGTDVFITRGTKEDVDKVQTIFEQVGEAAKK